MAAEKPARKVRAKTTKKPASIVMTEEEVIAAYYRAHPHLTPPEPVPEPKKKLKEKQPPKPKAKPIQAVKLDSNGQPLPEDCWPFSKVIGAVFTSVMIGLSIAIIILSL